MFDMHTLRSKPPTCYVQACSLALRSRSLEATPAIVALDHLHQELSAVGADVAHDSFHATVPSTPLLHEFVTFGRNQWHALIAANVHERSTEGV